MYRKHLLTPLILAAVGCASTEGAQFNNIQPAPPVVAEQETDWIPATLHREERTLVSAPKRKKPVNRRAAQSTKVNAVTTFRYEDDQVYKVAVNPPGMFTAIMLQPGEKIMGSDKEKPMIMGDPKYDEKREKWKVSYRKGPNATMFVAIVAAEAGLETNLLIVTDRHYYNIWLKSYSSPAMDFVKWTYRNEQQALPLSTVSLASTSTMVPFGFSGESPRQSTGSGSSECDPTLLNLRYSIKLVSGSKPAWMPDAAFDCGGPKVWIRFSALSQAAPALFVQSNGQQTQGSFIQKNNSYVVDRQFDVAELRIGETAVRITRGK